MTIRCMRTPFTPVNTYSDLLDIFRRKILDGEQIGWNHAAVAARRRLHCRTNSFGREHL